jgi:hypothetical protein
MGQRSTNLMPSQKTAKPDQTLTRVGDRLFEALTQQEIARLLDAVFAVLSPELRNKALNQLQPDTRQTVEHILAPPKIAAGREASQAKSVSIAKLEQTWSNLWAEWEEIVAEAAQEDGPYMTQEAHWEPPYFDQTAFIEDLERVAGKMRPLVQSAFQDSFLPDMGFAQALSEAEDEIAAAMPDWITIDDGFYLEENLTVCLLEWEWLSFRDVEDPTSEAKIPPSGGLGGSRRSDREELDAFLFAQHILEQFSYVALESNAFLDFFTQLPEADQRAIFEGLTRHRDTPEWKTWLGNTYSHWYVLYMYGVEQYAPERYLDNLRATIPQQWRNGLPVIEDLVAQKDYPESLQVIEETLAALLKFERGDQSWTPETALLFTIVSHFYDDASRFQNHKKSKMPSGVLLQYYQQTAAGLGQTDRANALSLQLIAFDHFFDWQTMFKAFEEAAIPQETRQALFASWREYIIQRAQPHTWGFGSARSSEAWWLHWLIESIVDPQKGPPWFQQQMAQWLAHLSGGEAVLGDDYGFLRLLTKDLVEAGRQGMDQYPRFYEVVIRPGELSSPDTPSRQQYLKQYAAADLLDQVMGYWKAHLPNLVPKPERAQKSDYTQQARWMAALRELAPDHYEALLAKWRIDHHRRRNLWQALAKMGLT